MKRLFKNTVSLVLVAASMLLGVLCAQMWISREELLSLLAEIVSDCCAILENENAEKIGHVLEFFWQNCLSKLENLFA